VPEAIARPEDALALLGRIEAFAGLGEARLASLGREVEWVRFHGGETVVSQGDVGDAAFFVLRGRVRVFRIADDGNERAVGERGVGDAIGEVALLTDETRTATVRAVRDTDVAQVSRAVFERLLDRDPQTVIPLVRSVVAALTGRVPDPRRVSAIALVADGERARAAADDLVDALAARAPVGRFRVEGSWDADLIARVVSAIDEQEARGGITIIDVDVHDRQRIAGVLRQVDTVLVVADASGGETAGVRAALSTAATGACDPRVVVVLVQPAHRTAPRGTASIVAGFDDHHHVRPGSSADFARVARHLLGHSVALALGGGGARGMAQIGAYRALVEAGVPIDVTGGSSAGGVIAAAAAAGWEPTAMLDRISAAFTRAKMPGAYTLPVVSILSPHRLVAAFSELFGDLDLEDLWLPCFVTTVDLTQCRLSVQRSGRVVRWLQATFSAPGILPPVVDDDGTVHVDGALLDNLPAVPARSLGAAHVVSVSVSRSQGFTVTPGVQPPDVAEVARRAVHGQKPGFPNLVQVLYRAGLVTGLAGQAAARAASDLFVEPAVERFGLNDYDKAREIEPLGYDAMRRVLDAHGDDVSTWD
jgi:NTE family protein